MFNSAVVSLGTFFVVNVSKNLSYSILTSCLLNFCIKVHIYTLKQYASLFVSH